MAEEKYAGVERRAGLKLATFIIGIQAEMMRHDEDEKEARHERKKKD